MSGGAFDILVVEDNPGDRDLILDALADTGNASRVSVVADGAAALAFLHREGDYVQAPRPHLVLLDLNVPKLSGREVLAAMKADPGLRRIPVIIFSSSEADRDVAQAYGAQANCFVTKPVDLDRFLEAVQAIERFWLGVARLPAADLHV